MFSYWKFSSPKSPWHQAFLLFIFSTSWSSIITPLYHPAFKCCVYQACVLDPLFFTWSCWVISQQFFTQFLISSLDLFSKASGQCFQLPSRVLLTQIFYMQTFKIQLFIFHNFCLSKCPTTHSIIQLNLEASSHLSLLIHYLAIPSF